jgi:nitroreductase
MDVLEALTTRTTVPQVKMADPGPDPEQIRAILAAGAAAPDHGKLRPWQFILIRGEARAELGELFARALRIANENASPEEIEKQRSAPLRAPLIVAVATRINEGAIAKIPEIEQIASAAAAAQNMLVAAHALGFGGKWSTGKNAYDSVIREALGVAPRDHILGFLYFGSIGAQQSTSPRPDLDSIVTSWPSANAG